MPHHRPARLEKTRLFLARKLIHGQPFLRAGVKLVPKNHPWRWFYESQRDLISEVTDNTLHPRPKPLVLHQVSPAVRRYALLSWVVFYLAVADLVSFLPGPGIVEPDPVTPAQWVGLTDGPCERAVVPGDGASRGRRRPVGRRRTSAKAFYFFLRPRVDASAQR